MHAPSPDRLIRAAVLLALVGLLLLLPILFAIRASFVGLFMLGSLLLTVSIALYVVAVVRDLRRGGAL
jgi:predicted membrane channel-forming protein YqfA (hemolysin III family)